MSDEANPSGASPEGLSVSDAGAQFASMLSTPEPTQAPVVEHEQPAPETATETAPEIEAEAGAEAAQSEELPDTIEGLAKVLEMDPGELSRHLKIKVKVNGEERHVTLEEAVKGQQLEADYRRKTAELAAERKAGEAQIQAAIQQRVQTLDMLANDFAANVLGNPPDPRLASENPAEYVAQKAAYDANLQKLHQARQERERLTQQQRAAAISANEAKLREIMPDWARDPDKGRKEIDNVRSYLVKQGVDPQEAYAVFNADHIMIARKAMLYDQLQATKPDIANKLKDLPKVVRPGGIKPGNQRNEQAVAALNRLKRTGGVNDAGRVFAQMLKGK